MAARQCGRRIFSGCLMIHRQFSVSPMFSKHHFKLVIVGGGSAGCALSAKFGAKLGRNQLAVIEPNNFHWYQAGWSLVGGGLKKIEATRAPMGAVLSRDATWLQDRVISFTPRNNTLLTANGNEVEYDFLILAMGVIPRFDLIKGLPEAFETPGVCSNYDPNLVHLTFKAIQNLKHGDEAVFTFPSGVIKCAGAPQKIMYLTDSYLRMVGKRENINITYNTSLDAIYSVPKYTKALEKIAAGRNLNVNVRTVLSEVNSNRQEAIFDVFDKDKKLIGQKTLKYNMLHIGPPCTTVKELSSCKELVDSAGFVDVNKETLQHSKFPNVFALGDCSNLPTSKTMAAVAAQVGILRKNVGAVLKGTELRAKYDGYTSCPFVTSRKHVVLAEFSGYTGQPLETFPVDQAKERRLMFFMKRYAMPFIYWNFFTKGWWEGPGIIRKALRLGFSK